MSNDDPFMGAFDRYPKSATNPDNVGGLPEFVAVGEFVGYGRVTGEPHVRMSSGLRPGVRLFTEDQMREAIELCRAAPAGGDSLRALFVNAGDSEAQFIADGENLDCPTCGGSGHVDDSAPAGSGEVEETLRTLLSERNHRTDGTLQELADRCLHLSRGDRDLISMLRKLQQGDKT